MVIASLARSRSSLAIGNVTGSAISNILGAFSLGLLFSTDDGSSVFDTSSKIYSAILLLLTTFVAPVVYFPRKDLWRPCGGVLIAVFVLYVISIAWAIGRGRLTAPEDSDSEDSGSDDDSYTSPTQPPESEDDSTSSQSSTRTPLLRRAPVPDRSSHSLLYHALYLLLGFLSICLASYILSHAASTITTQLGISDVLFGVVILAFATTLPEKFVAVFSGYRGHMGILVANTVGSNIFLLSLCTGVILVDTNGDFDSGSVNMSELAVMWGATVVFACTIWFGAGWTKPIGVLMLVAYFVFLALEFTTIRGI